MIVVVIDIFYKRYQMNQEENEKELEKDVAIALEDRKKLMIDAVTAISQMLDARMVILSSTQRGWQSIR